MRNIIVRLAVGDAFSGKADDAKWVHRTNQNGSAGPSILSVKLNGVVIAEFLEHSVIGWWWDTPEVPK